MVHCCHFAHSILSFRLEGFVCTMPWPGQILLPVMLSWRRSVPRGLPKERCLIENRLCGCEEAGVYPLVPFVILWYLLGVLTCQSQLLPKMPLDCLMPEVENISVLRAAVGHISFQPKTELEVQGLWFPWDNHISCPWLISECLTQALLLPWHVEWLLSSGGG